MGGVKFNSGVRYSQWAINSRAHDFYANTTSFGLATYNVDGTPKEQRIDSKKKLDYVPGLVAKSMIEAADYYQGFDWSKPWFLSVKEYGDTYYKKVPTGGGSLDDLNAVKLYIGLYNNANATDANKINYKTAIGLAQEGLKAHNKSYSIQSGTLAGDAVVDGWFHKATYNNQMWLDGAYMGSALLAQIVNFNFNNGTETLLFESIADWDMVFKQLNIVWNMCWNPTDKLMYHAFEANAGTGTGENESKSHADTWAGLNGKTEPYTFHSAAYWGRANAWYLMALVDVLEAMKNANQENSTNYTTLKQHLADLAAGIAARQDATTGGWYQVMDDPSFKATSYNGKSSTATNYIETSATAIFAAAYFKAVRLGVLSSTTQYDYKTIAKNAFEGLVNNYIYLDNNGDMQIWGSCRSAGLGGDKDTALKGAERYHDGSKAYYLLGYDVPMVEKSKGITEGKVLGGFIMAATEYERAYQNQDSKQILFAKDLAPSYDFTTTEGKLDATAYGDDNVTVTYQWYKDNAKIANATSATYAPTVTGSYYCEATANGKTITTSPTKVTAKSNSNTDNDNTDNNGGSENGTTGNIFSYTIKTSEAAANTPYNAEGGTVTLGAAKVDAKGFYSDGDLGKSKYILVSLTNNTLKEGDVITIAIECPSKNGGLLASSNKQDKTILAENVAKGTYEINYTVTSGDVLNSKNSFYLFRNGSSTYIKSISITRAVKKYTVSATAGTGGSVTIANASGTTVNSGSEVEANTSLTFTATPSDGYVFVNWTDASNKEVSTNATYTTTVTAAIALTANFKAKTTVDPTESEVIYDFTGSIGTTTAGTSCTTANNVITFNSNFSAKDGKYITIKPKTGGFKAGDVITLEGYCDSKNLSGVIIYSDVNGSSIFKSNVLAKSADGGSKFTYTIEKDCDALYLGRYGGGTTRLTSLKVERSASSSDKTRLTASFERNADVVVNTTTTVPLPTLTVKAGGATLTADKDYNVVYTSNAENVATLSDNNTITINNLGIATITATVTPTDANTYEGTTATYQLSVKAPSPLNVSVTNVTINTTDAEEVQPVIKVYGDNDKLLKLGQDYTLSFDVSGDKNVTVDKTTGKFSVKKNTGNTEFIKGTSLITVTATPTDKNNYTEGTLQFSYSVSEGKIKPVFLDSFKGITINLHQDSNNRTITVPLIHDGEDVSSYFDYTYTIKSTGNTTSVTGNPLKFTPEAAGTYTVTVNAAPGSDGTDNYSDVYDSPDPITFTLKVDSKNEPIIVTPDSKNIKMYAGTTQVAPDLTVTKGTTTLGYTEYNVTWFSTSPGVAKVDATTGKIEAVSEGTANIRVVVTGDNLESTTALITIDVDDPAMYRVKGSGETYKNHTTMWNQDKNMSVVLGGWLFSDDVEKIVATPNTSSEGLSAKYHWGPGASKAKWKLTGFDYYVAGDNNKNARQENGSNALPETTKIYNAYFADKGTIKDNMFNVPCSGSFLEFNPVTNGKVTVHIFQNGVFDAKTTKKADGTTKKEYQYRPQRRVFVMDEAGNFVESTAHIESTNGKPTGGIQTIDKYTWDLDSKTLTIGDVRSHFNGIPTTFDMTADAFKNNVYESLLDTKKVPNAAANDRKGSHGWSVLADSPVTYTFNVKAGKTYYLYNFGSKIGFYGFSFDETKPTVEEVSYADDQSNTITATAAGNVAKVTVNRSMKKDVWTTCVLPFSLNRQQVDAIFGPAYSAAYPQGTQILYFDRVEGNKVYFVRHAYNTIVAGKPFLIKPTKDVTSINTAEVPDYPYVTIENTEPADWCTGNGYTWASSYSNDMTVQEGDGFISKDGLFKNFVGQNGTLKGFRGYLKRTETQTGAKPIMLQVVNSSNVDGDNGETTGIEDLIIDADGQLMPANGKVYNINGQLVSEDANSFQSLPSGIYIINGKKYIK